MQCIYAAGLCGRIRLYTHGVTNVGGVTAGQPRDKSSNVGVSLRVRWDTTLVMIVGAGSDIAAVFRQAASDRSSSYRQP